MKLATTIVHIVSAAIFALMIYVGAPMGESQMNPWDVVTMSSLLVVVILCPLTYICLWKKKILWTRFLFDLFGVFALGIGNSWRGGPILWFQWPNPVLQFTVERLCAYLREDRLVSELTRDTQNSA